MWCWWNLPRHLGGVDGQHVVMCMVIDMMQCVRALDVWHVSQSLHSFLPSHT